MTTGKGFASESTAIVRGFRNFLRLDIGEGLTAEVLVQHLPTQSSFDLGAEIIVRETEAGPRGESSEFRFQRLIQETDTGRSEFARWRPIVVLSSQDQRIQLDCLLYDEHYDD